MKINIKRYNYMKLGQLLNAMGGLNQLSKARLSLTHAFRLEKFMASVQPDLDVFNSQHQKIIEEYKGWQNANGGISFSKEYADEIDKAYKELNDIDIQVSMDGMPLQIPLTDNIELSALEITAIKPFVKFITQEDIKNV